MKTARSGSVAQPLDHEVAPRSSGAGGRTRCAARSRRSARGARGRSMISPAQVPSTGRPASPWRADRGLEALALDRLRDRRPLAAGDARAPSRPSRSAGVADLAQRRRRATRSISACAAKSPWSARTPTTSERYQPRSASSSPSGELGDVVAAHRLAEPGGRRGDPVGVARSASSPRRSPARGAAGPRS